MQILTLIAGVLCLFAVLLDAFQTIILPRRATGRFRLTRIFYIVTWRPWVFFTKRLCQTRRRETVFSYYGPMSLIFLLAVWAGAMVVGFALIYYALGSPFNDSTMGPGLRSDFYVSGTTIFTLGLGDVTPHSGWARAVVILESGTGLGLLAVVMGYFPVLYSAFSRREVSISLLDARAGSPPTAAELLRRHSYEGGEQALALLLVEWERWSAELLESHISYPLLCYFRSQHSNQSWISALTAVLDTSALLIAGVRGPRGAAGAADLCHGAACAGGPGADFLAGANEPCAGPAAPGTLRPALQPAVPERGERLPGRALVRAAAGDAGALRGLRGDAKQLSVHAAAAVDCRPAAQGQLAGSGQAAGADGGCQRGFGAGRAE